MVKIILLFAALIVGGLIQGAERVVRARMQNRIGPPILQPFYDTVKLLKKKPAMVEALHSLYAVMHFIAMGAVVGVLLYGGHLLYIVFLHLLATTFLILAGYGVRSIYSHIGANRELLVLLIYEPILIFISVGLYLLNGSFYVADIAQSSSYIQLLFALPLLLVALIKLSKSPFDNAHAHQEIIGGVEIEYGGILYEFLYTAKWFEYFFIFALFWLLGGGHLVLSVNVVLFAFFAMNLIDNATARVQMRRLLSFGALFGYGSCMAVIIGISYV
jgi:ech hydrogenase subunit B